MTPSACFRWGPASEWPGSLVGSPSSPPPGLSLSEEGRGAVSRGAATRPCARRNQAVERMYIRTYVHHSRGCSDRSSHWNEMTTRARAHTETQEHCYFHFGKAATGEPQNMGRVRLLEGPKYCVHDRHPDSFSFLSGFAAQIHT